MHQIKHLFRNILNKGEFRTTRSGEVISTFVEHMEFDLRVGFPATTIKKLMFKSMVGELLWFLSKSTDLSMLNHYTNKGTDAWNIWTNDCVRWTQDKDDKDSLGKLYAYQWREFDGDVDQITNLINSLKNDPTGRYHRVTAWNPKDVTEGSMALPACHTDFQCYVTENGELNLHYNQRSADAFLGVPFNVASYALLTHILARLTGLTVGKLTCTMVDAHIYTAHMSVIGKVLRNPVLEPPKLVLPEFESLEELLTLTAVDFDLVDYDFYKGDTSAPLLVG